VQAAAYAQALYGKAWSALGRRLDPLHAGESGHDAVTFGLAMDRRAGCSCSPRPREPRAHRPRQHGADGEPGGTPEVARINFDCLWGVLLDEEPDFLD
jgi:hypothetical protein